MLSHAEIYANVIKARPECVALCPLLRFDDHRTAPLHFAGGGWWAGDDAGVPERIANALIKDHWTEMLSEGRFVLKSAGTYATMIDVTHAAMWYPTRIHALAEFLVPGSTKEKDNG